MGSMVPMTLRDPFFDDPFFKDNWLEIKNSEESFFSKARNFFNERLSALETGSGAGQMLQAGRAEGDGWPRYHLCGGEARGEDRGRTGDGEQAVQPAVRAAGKQQGGGGGVQSLTGRGAPRHRSQAQSGRPGEASGPH